MKRESGNIGLRLLSGGDRMTQVDSAVLNLTEWMCRRFQTWTGRTNVWLAFQLTNLSVVVYFIWVAGLYLLTGDVVLRVFVALFCGGVFFVLTRTIFKSSIEVSEAEAYRRVAKGLRNPRRIRDAQLRIAFLTLSIVLSYPLWFAYITLHLHFVLFTEALIILTTVVLYVIACDPLPPCAGTVKEWLRGIAPPVRDANAPLHRRTKVSRFRPFVVLGNSLERDERQPVVGIHRDHQLIRARVVAH
jgi:hypothetical protein